MLSKEVVKRIVELARVDSKHDSGLQEEISKIIGYIDKLKEVNTEGVEPLRSLRQQNLSGLVRKDEAVKDPAREDILKNAPDFLDDFFKIPKVIK